MHRFQELLAALGDLTALVEEANGLQELFQTACERVAAHTMSSATYIVTVDPDRKGRAPCLEAVAGPARDYINSLSISTNPKETGGNGLFGRVYRAHKTVVMVDAEQDGRFAHMKEHLAKWRILSAAGVPIVIDGRCRGVLVVGASDTNHYTDLMVALLERIAGVLALGISRLEATRNSARYQSLYSALSNVNALIARGPAPKTLFAKTVDAIAASSDSLRADVALVNHDTGEIRVVAAAGRTLDRELKTKLRKQKFSTNPEHAAGQGILGTTYRCGKTVVWLDLASHENTRHFRETLRRLTRTRSLVGIPVFLDERCAAILVLGSTEPDYFEADIVPLSERLGESLQIALIAEQQKTALQKQALTDHLTGLPNRALFRDRLEWAMHHARRYRKQFAVVVADIDNFKSVNDRCGHPVGDDILRLLGANLTKRMRKSDVVARFSADVFVLLVWADGEGELANVLLWIQNAVEQTGSDEHEAAKLTVSIGLSVFPGDGVTADELTRRAHLALHRVKRAGGAAWGAFEPSLELELLERHRIEERFLAALEVGQITYHFQPILDLWTEQIAAAEMLVRWVDPDSGSLPPSRWIPTIEEHVKLVLALGRHGLVCAITQLADWHAKGTRIELAVNIGAHYLRSNSFVDDLKVALRIAPELATYLVLEITETAVIEDFAQVADVLKQARALGVKVALDDFGTGHGSLTYLLELPADHLKIDLLFVQRMLSELRAFGIVSTAAQGARMLGMSSVAEGAETDEHIRRLIQIGCRYVQGYAIARPMGVAAFDEWMQQWQMPQTYHDATPIAPEQNQLLASLVLHRQMYQELERLRSTPRSLRPKREPLFCPLADDPKTTEAYAGQGQLFTLHAALHHLESQCATEVLDDCPTVGSSMSRLALLLEAYEAAVNDLLLETWHVNEPDLSKTDSQLRTIASAGFHQQ